MKIPETNHHRNSRQNATPIQRWQRMAIFLTRIGTEFWIGLPGAAGPCSIVEPVVIAAAAPSGESNRARMREVRTVTRQIAGHRNHVALFKGVSGPTMLHQRVRAAQFEFPARGFAAWFSYIQGEVRMRVQPFHPRYGAFEIPLLG